ncbi:ABC transporter permease [Luteipulveratus mongoliensis]|uniref:Sugar ABC transporter ATPase n=1 Tax=Luteipulveratus mongoliensis TaxID=571913 RepID=A0A0K1JF16_9MICO|nr:ABC transporter permease subunit [Luteipulveratus mongoliensis]AKU15291.1 sugar ABC transporter ATPase [Luteipulveratus mongoliensis]
MATSMQQAHASALRAAPVAARRTVSLRSKLARDRSLLVMVAPAVILLLTFTYIPLLGNVVAFMDFVPYLPLSESPWVGTANFQAMFEDPAFWNATWNTLQINGLQLIFSFPIPLMLALLLHSVLSPVIRGVVQSVIYLPHFLSWVIVVAMFQQTLGGTGAVTDVLRSMTGESVNLMTNPGTFKALIVAQGVWKDAGWGTILFLAALTAIDYSLYESAAVDGAGGMRRFWHITLPGIRPIIVLLLILQLGQSLTVGFEQILLQRDAVGAESAEVLDTYVYFHGVVDGDWSIGVAAGLLKGVVGLVLILAANKLAHSLGEQGVYSRDN